MNIKVVLHINVLLLTFKSYWGESRLYISEKYAFYEMILDDVNEGVLIDFDNNLTYKVLPTGKYILKDEELEKAIGNPFGIAISEAESIDTIPFKGFQSIAVSATVIRNNLTIPYTKIFADIPAIAEILPSLLHRLMLPIVPRYVKEPYLYNVLLSIENIDEYGNDCGNLVLHELNEIKLWEVDAQFFNNLLALPDLSK